LALKIKGDLLLLCERYNEALAFFESIINVQPFSWATLGLVQCYIQQNEFDIAEKTLIHLALQNNRMLVAYDMLAELQIKQNAFEEALECIDVATDISPRSIARHQKAVELSRLTHDYESQYNSAKKVVRFARNSIHDTPDIYLSAARAGVDYAMTSEPELTRHIVKQSSDYLAQLKATHAKAEVQHEVNIINARVLYLKDDMESARALLNTIDAEALSEQSPEALIDAAKAFNDVGLKKSALQILDTLEKKLESDDTASALLCEYVKQEKAEKASISVSPKNLNNAAVLHYRKGEMSKSFATFEQAFRVMPKNAAIALNLLQATVMRKKRKSGDTQADEHLIKQCRETLENATLTEEQRSRYENIKLILRQVA
jgi:tetratricopeptide (TPR) repeat protein